MKFILHCWRFRWKVSFPHYLSGFRWIATIIPGNSNVNNNKSETIARSKEPSQLQSNDIIWETQDYFNSTISHRFWAEKFEKLQKLCTDKERSTEMCLDPYQNSSKMIYPWDLHHTQVKTFYGLSLQFVQNLKKKHNLKTNIPSLFIFGFR